MPDHDAVSNVHVELPLECAEAILQAECNDVGPHWAAEQSDDLKRALALLREAVEGGR